MGVIWNFLPNLAVLAVLFSRQIPNSSHIFSAPFKKKDRYNTIETHNLTFLTHISLDIGGVKL